MRGIRNIGLGLVLVMMMSVASASTALATTVGVMAWGENLFGELGNGTTISSDEPVSLSEQVGVTAVSAGVNFSLELLEDGTVRSWGYNSTGQLGDGTYESSDVPVDVSGLSDVTAISAGAYHALALLADGEVEAFGEVEGNTPVAVEGLSGVTAIAAGGYHNLALLTNGTVVAWGYNHYGQLGNGTTISSETPVEVSGLSNVVAISAGKDYSLALLSDGKIFAWGENEEGELGDGTTIDRHTPVEVKGLAEEVTAISASASAFTGQSLALLRSGKVMAWGANGYGQLGDGTTTSRDEAVLVSGLTNIAAVSAGGAHSLALLGNGGVLAWGDNQEGQLGDGTSTGPETCGGACSRTPIAVNKLGEYVTGISGGGGFSLAFATGPTVLRLEPDIGTPLGGTHVMIKGDNLTGVTEVKFGSTKAASFLLLSSTLIEAVSPNGGDTEYVTLTGPSGLVSNETPEARFVFAAPEAPEFGRCRKVAKKTGKFGNDKCKGGEAAGNFEWTAGVAKPHFTLAVGESKLETLAKTKVVCKLGSGSGEYVGGKELKATTLTFTGCESGGSKCTTVGASTGEVVTSSLEGTLGREGLFAEIVALDLFPAGKTGPLAEFSCGSTAVVVQGSVLVPMATGNMAKERTLKFSASGGKQKPEKFEGEAADVLEASFAGGAYEQAGLTVNVTQYSEEEVEVNPAI